MLFWEFDCSQRFASFFFSKFYFSVFFFFSITYILLLIIIMTVWIFFVFLWLLLNFYPFWCRIIALPCILNLGLADTLTRFCNKCLSLWPDLFSEDKFVFELGTLVKKSWCWLLLQPVIRLLLLGTTCCALPPAAASTAGCLEQRCAQVKHDAQTDMLLGEPRSAICVQRFDDLLSSAIHTTYRSWLRSPSTSQEIHR